ncbi:UNVERIFIED_CONTAM: hypothetical protein H355_008637 [Colinus virginianus]|nr:hypothetical protein H355_008637 [Colinus virginianus]
MKEVVSWSPEEVTNWLMENAVPEYCEPLKSFTGQDLINLTEEDFKKTPLSRVSSDSGQQLLHMIESLKMAHHIEAHKNGHVNGHIRVSVNNTVHENGFSSKTRLNGVPNGYKKEMIKIPMPEPERLQYPMEWGKTFLAFIYALFCFIFTTVTISVVHERVPPKEVQPPLPDAFFDRFDRVQWAFSICEINGMILVGLWFVQWLLLKYKSIISRRFFCIVGTLYLYRCITMYVTTLPVPGMHFKCSPKLFGDWESHLRRIMKLIAGGGLSITGSHNMCGDYLYSGHTVILTLTYLFIKELGLFLSSRGLGRDGERHSDAAGPVCSEAVEKQLGSLCSLCRFVQQVLKEASQTNLLARVWWYKPFQYFEKNVQGIVPRSYHWPFPWPVLHRGRQVKYSRLLNDT